MDFSSNMDVKRTFPSTGAANPRSKMPALRDAADPTQKAKKEHFLRVMAEFDDEQGRHRSKCLR